MIRWILFFLPVALFATEEVPITVEHAVTLQEVKRGLMHRDHLPDNHGMLFHYNRPGVYRFWMFNCLIPLSAVFLDQNGVVLSVQDLDAHPELYREIADLNHLDMNDPAVKTFLAESITSPANTQYVLEMSGDWVNKHGIQPGDRVVWTYPSPRAKVILRK